MARKEKKYHFIYKTTNLLSGKYYIGMHSTDDLNDGYMGSGRRLKFSINKYGKDNHKVEILEQYDCRKDLKNREKELVCDELLADEMCMNLVRGGEGGYISDSGIKRGAATTNIIHKSKKAEWGAKGGLITYNKYGSFLDGNRCDWTDRVHSNETLILMKNIKIGHGIGENNSQYGTCWVTKELLNKKIKSTELLEYESNGWVKGRKIKNKLQDMRKNVDR